LKQLWGFARIDPASSNDAVTIKIYGTKPSSAAYAARATGISICRRNRKGIEKLQRRIKELEQLDIASAYTNDSGEDQVAISNVRDTIRDVFGTNSPEFMEHQHIELWAGGVFANMSDAAFVHAKERGRIQTIGILKSLIGRLQEKRQDIAGGSTPAPSSYFDRLNLHPRIADVAHDLFMDGHH